MANSKNTNFDFGNVLIETPTSIDGHSMSEISLTKLGRVVILSGIFRGAFPESTYTSVCTLPVGFRPPASLTCAAATVGGRTGIVEVQSGGMVRLNHITGATRAWMGINVVFIV